MTDSSTSQEAPTGNRRSNNDCIAAFGEEPTFQRDRGICTTPESDQLYAHCDRLSAAIDRAYIHMLGNHIQMEGRKEQESNCGLCYCDLLFGLKTTAQVPIYS